MLSTGQILSSINQPMLFSNTKSPCGHTITCPVHKDVVNNVTPEIPFIKHHIPETKGELNANGKR